MVTPEMLSDMKRAVILTGMLSELHIKNLKAYPLIFFDNINTVTIDYNLISDDGKMDGMFVHYRLSSKNKRVDNLNKRLEAIESAVKNILWKEVDVKVYLNDKLLEKKDVKPRRARKNKSRAD